MICVIPATVDVLLEKLVALQENWDEVKSAELRGDRIEVDLSGKANFFGYSDFYIPLRRDRIEQARQVFDRIKRKAQTNQPPSIHDANDLYEVIDINRKVGLFWSYSAAA